MKYLLTILVLFAGMLSFAQGQETIQDTKAEPYLNSISKIFRTENPYQVEFKYEIYSAIEDARVSDYGTIIIQGDKYKLKTEDTEVYFNGQFLWSYNSINEEVYQSEPSDNSDDQIFSKPFQLIGNYKDYFKYRFVDNRNINGLKLIELDLYPNNLDTPYSSIKLLVTATGKDLYSIKVKQKDGIDLTIFITDIIQNIKISESAFSWNEKLYPDVLLIEM